jgi:hypothetical protein
LEQQNFFNILDEFFARVTGKRYSEFSSLDDFGDEVRKQAHSLGRRGASEWNRAIGPLFDFYNGCGTTALNEARQLGGLKLVLGGGSRFTPTHLDSVSRALLYADSVLIPDPVLPWLETDRSEEAFRHVLTLKAIFTLLHLKPLVDAGLEYPPVYVFQSWERSLAARDPMTPQGTEQLVTGVFSSRSGVQFDGFTDLTNKRSEEFLQIVEREELFVPPGGTAGQPISLALEEYLADIRTWRSAEHQAMIGGLPTPLVVLLAIMERLEPQYHLMENSDELGSHPLVCIPAQSHYYKLCTDFFIDRLQRNSLVSDDTIRTMNAIQRPELSWLSNIQMSELVELRRNNENEKFRQHLQQYTSILHGASLDDLDRVTSEVSQGISSLIISNRAELARIESKYRRKHSQTAAAAVTTLVGVLVPTLAPFWGATVAPLALAGKYVWNKVDERSELNTASRSLMGVLARAKSVHQG